MKRELILSILLSICSGLWAQETEGIEINEKNFPDPVFREYISIVNLNGQDGILTQDEIKRMTNINLGKSTTHGAKVRNLKGLEYFIYLESLDCSGHELTELDISALKNLKSLECSRNPLSSLDVSNNPELEELHCRQNQLSQLDVSNNMKLTTLDCCHNKLTSLDVSKNTSLKTLGFSNNSISSLDYELPELTDLDLSNNPLASVNLSAFPKLQVLWMQGTPVKKLDVTDLSQLGFLYFEDGQLEELTISGCPKLHDLRCQNNNLSVLNISGAENITMLDCSGNQLEELDLTACELVNELYCNNNLLKKLKIPTKCYWIRCHDNYLTELEFSEGKSSCYVLHCYGNFLTTDAVDKLIDALPVMKSDLGCTVYIYDARDEEETAKIPGWKPECNKITSKQVERGSKKGWIFTTYGNNGNISWIIDDGMTETCAAPSIQYVDGKLVCTSATAGAECITTITSPDAGTYSTSEIPLQAVYYITTFARKEGYKDSNVTRATLYWGLKDMQSNWAEVNALRANAAPVIVSSTGNTLTVQGAEDGEDITAYALDGRQLAHSVCRNGQTTLRLNAKPESVILVKIGNNTVKVGLK